MQAASAQSPDLKLIAYVSIVVLIAFVLATFLLTAGYRTGNIWVLIALAATSLMAERWKVSLSRTTELSVFLVPTTLAAIVLSPLAAGVVAAASMLGDGEIYQRAKPERFPRLKWATYTATGFVTGAVAGLTAEAVDGMTSGAVGSVIVTTFAATAAAEILDLAWVALTAQVRGRRMKQVLMVLAPLSLTSFLVYAPILILLSFAYLEISAWTLPLFLVPTLAFQRLYTLYQRERRLAEELTEANATLASVNLSFAEALVRTLDARDQYTAGHSAAVAIYSRDIAERMNLDEDLQRRAYVCGLVHDIGKIGLPASLLDKNGPLTLEERRLMQEHSAIGERILSEVESYADIALIVRHHHERIDGQGYPDGLDGSGIPILARIIAVADAYNAMTSNRPYRDAMPSRVARLRLAQAVETQFDTSVVAAFEAILAGANEDYRVASRADFLALTERSGWGDMTRLYETPRSRAASVA